MRSSTLLRQILTAAGLVAALMTAAIAHAAGLEVKNEAFKEVVTTSADGKRTVKREPLTRATPGTVVIYVFTYHNAGTTAATDVKLDNPIPKGLVYQAGSAEGANTVVDVSVDGGKHYGKLEALKVDGHAATSDDVTNVRWTFPAAIQPGAQGSMSYKALLP